MWRGDLHRVYSGCRKYNRQFNYSEHTASSLIVLLLYSFLLLFVYYVGTERKKWLCCAYITYLGGATCWCPLPEGETGRPGDPLGRARPRVSVHSRGRTPLPPQDRASLAILGRVYIYRPGPSDRPQSPTVHTTSTTITAARQVQYKMSAKVSGNLYYYYYY